MLHLNLSVSFEIYSNLNIIAVSDGIHQCLTTTPEISAGVPSGSKTNGELESACFDNPELKVSIEDISRM
jgi:hypothetical protein